ncbi:MAG TPA: FG-GAP-like repeat-containing protein, partial [Terriglobales bacterium]|nr:FG-GAP-like repeat-containing protein [Terriglobales bacterium]
MAILGTSATRDTLIHKRILVLLATLFFTVLVLPVAAQQPVKQPTTTTLSVSPINATAGQVVTLTATVSVVDGGPVTFGTVTFLSGKQVLGTVQVVQEVLAMGTATLKVQFPPGNFKLTAQFNGTNFFLPSQSQPPQQLTVTGTEPTITTLTATPDGRNDDFALSVFGFGFPPLAGTGPLSNLTQGGSSLGSIALPGPGTSTFLPQQQYGVLGAPNGIAVADYSGDGIADLAVTNAGDNRVSVLLGNGDGSFQLQQTYNVGSQPAGIAVADFNGDGIADLAVANASGNNVSVLLGNGDGTFPQQNPTYSVGVMPFDIAVADFNGDGIADLAVTNSGDGTVSVLLGNGDGTFPQENPTYGVGTDPIGIVVGDFNGDGIADLAVTNSGDGTVSVLLGKGDGSFQPQQTYAAGVAPYGIAVADFNGDGCPDLAVTNSQGGTVSVLLGNVVNQECAGTFPQQNPTYGVGEEPAGIAVADFNGDGFADLAVTSRKDGTISVLLGNGDGTFQAQQTYPVAGGPIGIGLADFNGDGVPDIAAVNDSSNTVSILLGGTVTSGQLNNVPVFGVGKQDIQSAFTPNRNFYAGSLSNVVPVNGSLIPTTTVVSSSQNPSQFNQPVTFTATVTSNDEGSPIGTVTFTDNGNQIPECASPINLVNNQAACTTSSLKLGSHTIIATYSGGGNFAPSMGTLNPSQVVNKATTQTVLIAVPPDQSTYLQLVTFTATVTGAFGGSPTGTVTFGDNGAPISNCTALPLAPIENASAASCSTATLAVGGHTIAATYNDDSNFSGSSGNIPYQVNGNVTVTTLAVSPAPPVSAGQVVTLTATVTADGAPINGGTVTFLSGKQVLATVQMVFSFGDAPIGSGSGQGARRNSPAQPGFAAGTATLKVRFAPGTYTLTARFNGISFNQPSQSAPQQINITGTELTITTLTDQPDGNNYDFTASVFGFGFP